MLSHLIDSGVFFPACAAVQTAKSFKAEATWGMYYNGFMSTPILATKLYIPPPRVKIVLRPRLIERLNEGLFSGSKLTLISASAGFGKTTLVSEWVAELWATQLAWVVTGRRG